MALTIGSTVPTNLYAITDPGVIPPVNSTEATPTLAEIQTQIAETLNQTLFDPSPAVDTSATLYTRQGILDSLLADSVSLSSNPLLNSNSLLTPLQNDPLLTPDNTNPLLLDSQTQLFGVQNNTSLFSGLNFNTRLALLSAAYGLPNLPTATRPADSSDVGVDTEA